ncbi:homeobox protein prospero-like isoform X2 [Drosophila hydei]|uniref:Large proline-rich protein BAG6 n=1 Tax=Drosophila hydei TaxID=7224 RepID=A0A6J2SNK2_DROHY|nr:homeobox protein prospero isoform X2 [Drosophila hydei]XP_030079283.1 homeobox protein prospero-like isoform X2 [Drosophila hydei]
MLINLKVKTLDARTHDFSIDNELTIRQFKEQIAEKTNIAAENQRIIYQGRVLADDKQVKEYDVDGKVLHVAERPPFSQRGANATNNDEPMRGFRSIPGRPAPRNLRNAPYFRALDGMLVGTMAIPVNNGPLTAAGARTPPNRFPNSSSFCINRITVAQHMIDCANNIAAYLENPEIGLNNQSLDILQRGHWTMESTVVEVGVSSTDMPRNNNIIDMVQDAVTAALSRNTPGRNYTVVQMPTVYTNEVGEHQQQQQQPQQQQQQQADRAGSSSSDGAASVDTSEETTAAAAVIIEDVIETDDEAADGSNTPPGEDERSSSPQTTDRAAAAGAATAGETQPNGAGIGPRRRTRPEVLASVFQRYRTVEQRLSPFLDRYYEILQQDPSFEEQDTTGRENAQRIYDRVSEALHYLSHAQHAISDLMLDLSQPGPRVLTCRPILVEQSGYIRSNNIFTPNLVAAPLAELIAQVPPTAAAAAAAQGVAPASASTAATATTGTQPEQPPYGLNLQQQIVVDVMGGGLPAPISVAGAAAATQSEQAQNPPGMQDNMNDIYARAFNQDFGAGRERFRNMGATPNQSAAAAASATGTVPAQQQRPGTNQEEMDPQARMARLIQAVVSATNDADLRQESPQDQASMQDDEMYARNRNARATAPATATGRAPTQQGPTDDELIAAGVADADAAAAVFAGLVTRNDNFEDPVDEPMVAPAGTNAAGTQPRAEIDPQMRMARLIQAVVNSATNDADLRLEFNVPNVMSINLPVHVMTAAVHPQAQAQGRPAAATDSAGAGETNAAAATASAGSGVAAAASVSAAPAAAAAAASTSSGTRSGEQRANTLPTTATQTRSTSRPQIQIGGNNNWAGRIAPTHTAFDRFLPCNSHHIREPEPLIQQQQQQQQQSQQLNNNISSSNNNNNNTNNNRRSANAATVTASRMPRSQSGTSLSRPMSRRRAAISRELRSGSAPGLTTIGGGGTNGSGGGNGAAAVGGVGGPSSASFTISRRAGAHQPNGRPMQRTISRLISAMFENFLVTNMRNHAQTALGDTTTGLTNATSTAATNAGAAATNATPAAAAAAAALASGSTPATASGSAPAATVTRETSNLRAQLRSFLHHSVFEGESVNPDTMRLAVGRALDWFGDNLLFLRQYERPEYNSRDSVCNTLRQSLNRIIKLCYGNSCSTHFEHQLKQICDQFRKRLYSVLFLCLGSNNAELYWRQLMGRLSAPLRFNFRNEALQFLCIYIDPTIPATTDTADAQQFLVLRNALTTNTDADPQPAQQSLDTDIEMAEAAGSSSSSNNATEIEPPLPAVTVGSEPWHTNFPNDWLPVITRDLQTQTEQTRPQPPYSDAYISGMSAKRRKIIQTEKPANVECLISSGVQRALQSSGLAGTNGAAGNVNPTINPDVVINAIAHDAVVQASYTEAVRSNARERLKQDIDYKPSKYPQITKFTEQK